MTLPRLFLSICALITLLQPPAVAEEDATPLVWGYGTRLCSDYSALFQPGEKAPPPQPLELQRYRDWFTGMVTGLSLATGIDMLYGTNVDEAMERLNIQCSLQPSTDLFNASVLVLQRLSTDRLMPVPRSE